MDGIIEENIKSFAKGFVDNQSRIAELEQENKKLKLHIEAKDKAYTALLKDYNKIKEDRDKMKAEIEQRLNAIRDLHSKY